MIGADRPPVAAAGAIAASAVPTAAGIGASAGVTGGAIARMLRDHDVVDRNAEYYEERIERGGIFVSVDARLAGGAAETAKAILERCDGHSADNPRVMAD
jgi:hypothetical protein